MCSSETGYLYRNLKTELTKCIRLKVTSVYLIIEDSEMEISRIEEGK